MSNRIAASRMADRMDVAVWMPRTVRRNGPLAAARGWLARTARAQASLPAYLRGDAGLAAAVPAYDAVLDFEARRLRV
jgi:hypothetical protein